MKRTISMLLVVLMTAAAIPVFAGCGGEKVTNTDGSTPMQRTTEITENEEPTDSSKMNEPETTPTEGTETADSTKTTEPETTPVESTENTEPGEKPTEASSFRACSIGTEALGEFNYWLYTPSDPTENMSLIVYLHGGSGKGDDLELITAVDGFPKYLRDGQLGDVRAYVIIPQLPSSQKGWVNGAAAVYELIQATISKYGIDKENVSLTGHSMGGTGTWNFALSYPTLFAKIAPLSGSVRLQPEFIEKLKNIPVWAFVGSADTIVLPDSSINFIAALKEAGGNAEITVFDGADHFTVPSLTYLDKDIDLIKWLIDKAD